MNELSRRRKCCCGVSFFFLILSIVFLAGAYNAMIQAILHRIYQVKRGTMIYDIWKDVPVPMYMNVYIFNLTNSEDFLQGAKPNLTELGPYVYREYDKNVNLYAQANFTITFQKNKTWYFDEDLSVGKLNDMVTTVNVLPVTAAFSVRDSKALLTGMNVFFEAIGEKSIITKPATEIIFDGYQDPLLDVIQKATQTSEISFDLTLGVSIPAIPAGLKKFDKFAWYYLRNGSENYEGIYNMYTGEYDLDEVGNIDWWNYLRYTDAYDGMECNHVTGSAGQLFPPGLTKTSITTFSSDLCSSIKIPYYGEMEDSHGIPGYRYVATAETFEGESKDCYCVNGMCAPYGTINVEKCKFGAPAFVSYPHFLFTNITSENGTSHSPLVDAVNGVTPDPEKHSFHMSLNSDLGIPLEVAARMQININVTSYKGLLGFGTIEILKNVPDVVLPLIWFEVETQMTDELAKQIKPIVFIVGTPFMTILMSFGLIISFICLIYTVYPYFKSNSTKVKRLN